jgi:hypothetical protein
VRASQDGLPEEPGLVDALALGQLRLVCELYPHLLPTYGWVDEDGPNLPSPQLGGLRPADLRYLFWANVFGPGHVAQLERAFLEGAPGWRLMDLPGGGLLYVVSESYSRWRNEDHSDVLTYVRRRTRGLVPYRPEKRVFASPGSTPGMPPPTGTSGRPSRPRARPVNWAEARDVKALLRSLPRKCSARKLRLFACACCYRVRDRFEGRDFWELVLLCERFADGRVTRQEVRRLTDSIQEAGFHNFRGFDASLSAAGECNFWGSRRVDRYTAWDAERAADACARYAAGRSIAYHEGDEPPPEYFAESADQCGVLRDLFGDPPRPVPFDPRWRTPAVLALAEGAYEERDFARLPVLADALEDAGCDDGTVLGHCRAGGEHHRGCWVVDGVLRKT